MLSIQVLTKCVQSLLEEGRKFVTPDQNVLQWFGMEPVEPIPAIAACRDQFSIFQNAQMLGDGGECYLKRLCQFVRCAFARLKPEKNGTTRWMRDSVKYIICLSGAHGRSILGTGR